MGCIRTESVVLLQAERCSYRISGTRGAQKNMVCCGFIVVDNSCGRILHQTCIFDPAGPNFWTSAYGSSKILTFLSKEHNEIDASEAPTRISQLGLSGPHFWASARRMSKSIAFLVKRSIMQLIQLPRANETEQPATDHSSTHIGLGQPL